MTDPVRIDVINAGEFDAVLEFWPDTADLKCTLKGTADFAVLTTFKNLLRRALEEASKRSIRSATFDVRDVKFMNSSCLKHFVWFLTMNGDLPPQNRFHVSFITRDGVKWQKNSLLALQAIGESNMSITTL